MVVLLANRRAKIQSQSASKTHMTLENSINQTNKNITFSLTSKIRDLTLFLSINNKLNHTIFNREYPIL